MINTISRSCEELKLSGVQQCYQSIADECGKIGASYSEYLEQILKYELAMREQRSRDTIMRPFVKTNFYYFIETP